jgi:cytochrome c oxidase assembly factor CtaG
VAQLIFSFLLNAFLFVNMMLQLIEHPRAVKHRRCLAYVDVVIIILLVVGVVERLKGSKWLNQPLYQESNPAGLQMLLICFCLILTLVLENDLDHFIC